MDMSDETTSAIEAGIRSAFVTYSRDDDPEWRSMELGTGQVFIRLVDRLKPS
jgi:hypothetical protein